MTNGKQKKKAEISLEGSQINRDGLPAGATAPVFQLPQLDGTELSLEAYRGRKILLVFSDPHCGPCNALAPQLEELHRSRTDFQLLMISRADPEAARIKAAENNLTFPIVMQKKWEISRKYEIFVTPIAYLINERGIIAADVAVGNDSILYLVSQKEQTMQEQIQARIDVLKQEFQTGQAELEKIERQRTYLHEAMWRISGAIQVLEELLTDGQKSDYQIETHMNGSQSDTVQAYASNP